jgi:hypothetical protein
MTATHHQHTKKVMTVFLASFVLNSYSEAFDVQSTYLQNAEYCMSKIETDSSSMFPRWFSSEISNQCHRYALKKSIDELDSIFFSDKISDTDYRVIFPTKMIDAVESRETLRNDEIYKQTRVGDPEKKSKPSLPTVEGYRSIDYRSEGE